MKKIIITLLSLLITPTIWAQHTITGSLQQHANATVRLKGYTGLDTLFFSQTTISQQGNYRLTYPNNYKGMGVLEVAEAGQVLVILSNEDFEINAVNIHDVNALTFKNSPENNYLNRYIEEQGIRNKKLAGLNYLQPLYNNTKTGKRINREIQNLNRAKEKYMGQLPANSYVKYYIQLRQFMEDRKLALNEYTERLPGIDSTFKQFNLQHPNLLSSGLLQDFLLGQYAVQRGLVEDLEVAFAKNNTLTDYILDQYTGNNSLTLAVSEMLLKYFEAWTMPKCAEYLSNRMLTQNTCVIEGKLQRRMEQYRTMKVGNKAPDIVFTKPLKKYNKLTDINTKKLVVFWASWCPNCMEKMPGLVNLYPKLKANNIEVVSISLDTDTASYNSAIQYHPWLSYCDFKQWESPVVKDYYVFGTPSFYLLDEENKILLKPVSVPQIKAYLEYVLGVDMKNNTTDSKGIYGN